MPRSSALRALVGVVVGALVGLSACGGSSGGAGAPGGEEAATFPGGRPEPAKEVGELVLTDHSTDPAGEPFPMRAPEGELLLVYFGYLSCPDVCPLTMADTVSGLEELDPEDADRVEVAFVTVDPARDDPARMVGYLEHFFPEGGAHALREADEGALNGVTYRFGAKWEAEPHQPGDFYAVAHTGDTYVVDDTGRVVWAWPFGTAGEELATAVRSLLATTYPST